MTSSEAIKNVIEERAERLRRFIDDNELIKVFVGLDGKLTYAEIVWHDRETGKDFFVKETGANLYAEIDKAFHTLELQVHKSHDKRVTRQHKKEPLKKSVLD